jgi:hypothetical protein
MQSLTTDVKVGSTFVVARKPKCKLLHTAGNLWTSGQVFYHRVIALSVSQRHQQSVQQKFASSIRSQESQLCKRGSSMQLHDVMDLAGLASAGAASCKALVRKANGSATGTGVQPPLSYAWAQGSSDATYS